MNNIAKTIYMQTDKKTLHDLLEIDIETFMGYNVEVDQDWENETTRLIFEDGSKLIFNAGAIAAQ